MMIEAVCTDCVQTEDTISLKTTLSAFREPVTSIAFRELASSFALYFASLAGLFISLRLATTSEIFILLICEYLLCGLTIAKIFSIQHDCGHNSFFSSGMLNRLVGRFCSLITLIPFTAWKEEHQEHHASFGKVDEQTFGDIWLMTVDQYRSSTWRTRCIYRIFRSRTFLLLIAPFGYLLVRQRIPSRLTRQRIFSILIHTLMIGGLYGLVFQAAGPLLWMVWLPPLYIASTIGVIIFAVEHQFDGTQWENKSDWEFYDAAVNSSSYLTMPRFLEWFTGSIGYHHLHHMSPRIPSYRLRECFFAVGNKLPCKKITIYSIPRQLQLTLWSAKTSRLISFREARSSYS